MRPGPDTCARAPQRPVRDHAWPGALRTAVLCAGILLALLLLVDAVSGALTPARAALWAGLAAALFAVLVPARVTAGDGWFASRGLLRERRVRTDGLVAVRWPAGSGQRLVLQDLHGVRIELDVKVLTGTPALWQLLEQGVRASLERGAVAAGTADWQRLSRRINGEAALLVFKVSGLE
ncbi:hypothetical protein AB0I68_07840 [Streptomyces sp. NPDC050448]|uniref:hypothetical protein n=1 Tax=Streptomyces sp. NPDC050448 TaxID=3155404 RepID=UPI00343E5D3D